MKKKTINFKIRFATKKDLPVIIKIIKSSYHKKYAAAGEFYSVQQLVDPNYATENGPYGSLRMFKASMISDLKNKLKKPFELFVAKLGREVVAFIIIEKNNKSFWVNNLMVKRRFQKMGVGKYLFKVIAKNKKPLYLWVNSKNPAKKFWKKLGFKEILQETLMLKN